MRNITRVIIAMVVILMTSCEKEEITPSQPELKAKPIECRKCVEGWDITEPVPPSNP